MILLEYGYMRSLVLLAAFIILLPSVAVAQFDMSALGGTPQIAITLSPTHPSPGDVVTASLDDYAGGMFGAQINWRYAGAPIPSATNQRQVQFVAGDAGSDTPIEVTLTRTQGDTQTLRQVISPVFMDIIIEPQTRVPDWYSGRALPSLGSQVNATVLLNDGSFIDPQSVVYTWRMNQRVLEGGSIRAGNQVAFPTPRGSSVVLSVTAADLSGNTIASRAVRVNIVQPELGFYEKHALYGMQAIPTISGATLIGSVVTLQAEPFFLDTRVYNRPDVAEWEINSVRTPNGTNNPYEITLQRTRSDGRTNVNFHVRSLQEILQGSEEAITLNF